MFNTTTIHQHRHQTEVVDRNVTINRAPTDESVELLREMEAAAEDKLIYRGEIRNNTLSAQWNVFEDMLCMAYRCGIRIKLNGNEHLLKFEIMKFEAKTQFDAVKLIRDKLSGFIANQIIVDAFSDAEFFELTKRLAVDQF
jgi:hypothetical protein